MDNVSDLSESTKIEAVLTAYQHYQTAVSKDALSMAEPTAKLPDAQVFVNESTGGVIIILPERHESTDDQVQGGAASVAKHVMAIPKVKIAVEEPVIYNGTMISNVGWGGGSKAIANKPQSKRIFDFQESAQGSISHQIYERQVGGMVISTSRYAAENMPSDPQRYNNPEINKTMVKNLCFHTSKAGDISVFPVGPDHLLARYDRDTLEVHLRRAGWKLLANR